MREKRILLHPATVSGLIEGKTISLVLPHPKGYPMALGDSVFITQERADPAPIGLMNRLWSRTIKFAECWEWMGGTTGKYGVIGHADRQHLVHRMAWRLFRGVIPDDMSVLHRCDVPWCFNPDHLWLGSAKQNMRDKVAKGRHRTQPHQPENPLLGHRTAEIVHIDISGERYRGKGCGIQLRLKPPERGA